MKRHCYTSWSRRGLGRYLHAYPEVTVTQRHLVDNHGRHTVVIVFYDRDLKLGEEEIRDLQTKVTAMYLKRLGVKRTDDCPI